MNITKPLPVLLLFLLVLPLVTATSSLYTYDTIPNNITLSYDALNRVVSKNSTIQNITYGYDFQYQGTIHNLTFENTTIVYDYDSKQRVVKETKTIDGIRFEKKYLYDSSDKVISTEVAGQDIDYIYNKQGKIQQIPNYITEANYNAFGSILNRTYANTLVQNFSYNPPNNRLTTITIPSVQNLAYAYDNVGNILTINDAQNNRLHTLTYDTLNRLITAKIGPDRFTYAYNPTGNILKIVRNNNESKKFMYTGLAHAPSQVIEGEGSVDIYHVQEINSTNNTRTVEFYLVNDQNQTITTNFTISFGDGTSYTNTSVNVSDYLKISVNHTYATAGVYQINITGISSSSNDTQVIIPIFGINAQLRLLSSNLTNQTFELEIHNDLLNQQITNVSWNCSQSLRLATAINLSGNQTQLYNVSYNYTSPGEKTFTCTATSLDGTDSASVTFVISGLVIENYQILAEDISSRVLAFDTKNNYYNLTTNVSITTDGTAISTSPILEQGQTLMSFVQFNYTSDGSKTVTVSASGQNINTTLIQVINILAVKIENYQRLVENSTRKMFYFDVRNNWHNGSTVRWNMTDPNVAGTATLSLNQTLMVMIETNYTTQNVHKPTMSAALFSAWDAFTDQFEIWPIEIGQLNSLAESRLNSVSELVIQNNLNQSQAFSWRYDTGAENITSTQAIFLNNSNVFVYIQSNYSSVGVYKSKATVNSSMFSHNQTGVVVN